MRHFEDLRAGEVFHTGEHTGTAAEIIAFGRSYDPQPCHTDAAAARGSFFGQLVASGWQTAAVSMRLMVEGEMAVAGGVIGQGVEQLRWPRPVVPGDRLRVVMEVRELRAAVGRPDRGVVRLRCRTLNQDGKAVQEMLANLLIARRPPRESPGA